jgi:glycine cleavage system aminomethyltransferase T
MENSWIEELRHHLKNADKAKLKQEWAEIEALKLQGPNAMEYVEFLCRHYSAEIGPCAFEEIEVKSNMTPNFSGSFFFVISQYERGQKSII